MKKNIVATYLTDEELTKLDEFIINQHPNLKLSRAQFLRKMITDKLSPPIP